MPRNVYSEIHLHLTWHTKNSSRVLVGDVEQHLHRYLRRRALKSEGVIVHAVGGVADHVHIAVTVPPTITISNWIGEVKGASAHYINHEIGNRKILEWQTGYGVVSFGTKDLEWVVQYIRDQEAHHSEGSIHDRLERIERETDEEEKAR